MGIPTDASREAHVSIARRIAQAHAQIRDLLEQADPSSELAGVRGLLEQLPELLREHFDDEEREGGLFDALRARQPSVDSQLKSLRQEHRSILGRVETLESYLERLDRIDDPAERHGQMERIQREAEDLIGQVRRHERAESRLTGDVLYVDEGGSG